jgi:hypothetical protein
VVSRCVLCHRTEQVYPGLWVYLRGAVVVPLCATCLECLLEAQEAEPDVSLEDVA